MAHHIHAWSITAEQHVPWTLHVVPKEGSVAARDVIQAVRQRGLRSLFDISHATVQVEDHDSRQWGCGGCARLRRQPRPDK